MSNADEHLYNIKSAYRWDDYKLHDNLYDRKFHDDIGFLLSEIEHREKQIEEIFNYIDTHMVNIPEYISAIANEYGLELENKSYQDYLKLTENQRVK